MVDIITYENLITSALKKKNLNSLISAEEEVERVVNHVPKWRSAASHPTIACCTLVLLMNNPQLPTVMHIHAYPC